MTKLSKIRTLTETRKMPEKTGLSGRAVIEFCAFLGIAILYFLDKAFNLWTF